VTAENVAEPRAILQRDPPATGIDQNGVRHCVPQCKGPREPFGSRGLVFCYQLQPIEFPQFRHL
jgi:hypothetical protein